MSVANREFNELAYNHDLIEYNTAAHILSVQAGTQELFLSTRLAAALAFIALNLKKSDFQKIKTPAAFSPFGNRNRAFKRRGDRGYAFVALVFNGGRYEGDEMKYVEQCVDSSNLGTPAAVLDAAAAEMRAPFWFSGGNDITSHFFRESAMSGHILETHSRLPLYRLTLQSLLSDFRAVCPPFLDSDTNFVELNEGRIDEYQPEMMHDAAHSLREYTRNLLNGCRGV